MVLYGLGSCDSCRKALKAIRAAGREVAFRDIRAEPLSAAERAEFVAAFGERIVNRASTTWRGLSQAQRAASPEALLAAHPTLMKRPVIRAGDRLHLGWTEEVRAALLA
ncbi:arsenate reductase family protein [Albidovulum sp.]